MSHDRNTLITAYRLYTGCTDYVAARIVRGVESAYAEKQNAELQQALDEADGQHMKEISAYREQIAAMERIMDGFPDTHMRFGIARPNGTIEEPTKCADWCYACKLDQLQVELAECKKRLGTT